MDVVLEDARGLACPPKSESAEILELADYQGRCYGILSLKVT